MATEFETFLNTEIPRRAAYLTVDNTAYAGNPNLATIGVINSAPKGTWFLNNTDNTLWYKKVKTDPQSWEQLLGASGATLFIADCLTSDSVGDAVYVTGPEVGGYAQVTKCDIDNSDYVKNVAVGIINEKLTTTRCIVQVSGPMEGVYLSLTPGKALFVNLNAQLTQTRVSDPVTGTRMVQPVGYALSASAFMVNIGPPTRLRAG